MGALPAVPAGRFVLGAAQLGQSYGNGADRSAPTDHEVSQIFRGAAELGIVDLDTARAYGDSERVIGRTTAAAPDWRIVTKIRPFDLAADATADEVASAVRRSTTASLEALRVSCVDTLLLHRAADLQAAHGAAVRILEDLVGEGVTRRWGVSISQPSELLAALQHPSLGYLQLPLNLLDRRWRAPEVLEALAARPEVAVTARSVLLQGLLVADRPGRWPVLRGVDPAATIAALRDCAAACGRSPAALAVGYVLAQPRVDAVVLGVRRTGQLLDLAAAVALPPLSDLEVDRVHRMLPAGSPDLIDPARWPRS